MVWMFGMAFLALFFLSFQSFHDKYTMFLYQEWHCYCRLLPSSNWWLIFQFAFPVPGRKTVKNCSRSTLLEVWGNHPHACSLTWRFASGHHPGAEGWRQTQASLKPSEDNSGVSSRWWYNCCQFSAECKFGIVAGQHPPYQSGRSTLLTSPINALLKTQHFHPVSIMEKKMK